jgi:kynureninase
MAGGAEGPAAGRRDGQTAEEYARAMDRADPLRGYRDQFHLPARPDGTPWIYFVGNSLGLMPRAARATVLQELDDWATLGVEGHFHGKTPWFSYHEVFRETGARLVGAIPGEVVMMNSLTVNLHLMLATFYQPVAGRSIIATEDCAFPSDTYALETHIRHRGFDPETSLLVIRPRAGETLLRTEDIEGLLERRGKEIALLMLGGVNYYTGQLLDLARITRAAGRQGCAVGFDLAHAAGNAELHLHDWNVDFAVWCSYKYLNAGPGAVAGCFVHERHGRNLDLPRLAGWWGNAPDSRFLMHLNEHFVPQPGADGWQVSNPPILSLAPLQASLAIFDQAGMPALRKKSLALTAWLQQLIDELAPGKVEIISPREPGARGCQLSLRVKGGSRELFDRIQTAGVLCDYRHPDVIRVAPVPLYNTFHEVWSFARILQQTTESA